MRLLRSLASIPIALTVGCAPHVKAPEQAAAQTVVAKIDSTVLAAMDTARQLPVLVLGHTQLLERLHGLEQFAAKNDQADRRVLRSQVIASLKRIAEPEQQRILKALGKPRAERSLWIANVMTLTLTPDEIRRAAALRDVEFIYPSVESIPSPETTGNVALLSAIAARAPFTTEGKRVAWNIERLGAPRVWQELEDRGEGALVAVIDNGANYLQHNLRSNIWRNTREIPNNGVDDDRNGYIDDAYGYDFANMRADVRDTSSKIQHGTWTSGIVGGDGTDGNFQQSAKLPYQIQSPKDIPSVIAVGGVDTAFAVMPYSSLGPAEWGSVALYHDYPLPGGLTKPDVGVSRPELSGARGGGQWLHRPQPADSGQLVQRPAGRRRCCPHAVGRAESAVMAREGTARANRARPRSSRSRQSHRRWADRRLSGRLGSGEGMRSVRNSIQVRGWAGA